MKRIIIFLFLIIINSIYAAPVGNPFDPEIIEEGFLISPASFVNFRLGYEGNFVSDARLDKKDSTKSKVDDFKIDVNSGSFILNLQSRVDLYGNVGAARIRTDWRFSNAAVISRIELESNYRLAWAAGGKIILYQWGNTALDLGGRYYRTKPTLSFITLDGVPQDKASSKVKFKEWQIDMGLAHSIDIFTPYVGVKYSQKRARVSGLGFTISDDGVGSLTMKSRNNVGVYVGVTLSNKKYFLLSFEARFVDEDAISVFGELKF